jgi:hypothetical protein
MHYYIMTGCVMDSRHITDDFSCLKPDELRDLFEQDPERFNQLADDAIRQACNGRTPNETIKLSRMQWRIDAHLRKGKTPLERLRIMENMFYDQVYSSDGHLSKLMAGWASFQHLKASGRPPCDKPTLRLLKKDCSRRPAS